MESQTGDHWSKLLKSAAIAMIFHQEKITRTNTFQGDVGKIIQASRSTFGDQ